MDPAKIEECTQRRKRRVRATERESREREQTKKKREKREIAVVFVFILQRVRTAELVTDWGVGRFSLGEATQREGVWLGGNSAG